MAVVQYSALVTQLRGKLGGSQFNKGHNVQTLQRKSTPTIRQTPAQMRQRQIMGIVQRAWKTETPERRAQAAAAAQSNPVYNRRGQQVVLTGYHHYVKMMSWRLLIGVGQNLLPITGAIVTSPVGAYAIELSVSSMSASIDSQTGDVFFTLVAAKYAVGVPPEPTILTRAYFYITPVDGLGRRCSGGKTVFWLYTTAVTGNANFDNRLILGALGAYGFTHVLLEVRTRRTDAGAETGYWSQIIELQ